MKLIKSAGLFLAAATLGLSACEKEEACAGTIFKTFTNTDFSRISAGSTMHLHISKGNDFSIRAEGCSRDVNDLRVVSKPNGVVEFDFSRNVNRRSPVEIDITLPNLISSNLSGASEASITGFGGGTTVMRFVLSGASKANVDGTSAQTQFDLSGASELTLKGNTNLLTGTISGASELKAFTTPALEVDISASGGSKAYVHAQNILRADASGGSRIVYRGSPSVKETSSSGGAQVIPE